MKPNSVAVTPAGAGLPDAAAAEAEGEDLENNDDRLVRAAKRRERRLARSERAHWWSTKLHALIWVVGALAAFFFSNFYAVAMYSPNVNATAFWIGVVLLVLTSAALIKIALESAPGDQTQLDYEKAQPKFLLATSLSALLCFIIFNIAFWPVYRIFTPFLLTLFWLGGIMLFHFVP